MQNTTLSHSNCQLFSPLEVLKVLLPSSGKIIKLNKTNEIWKQSAGGYLKNFLSNICHPLYKRGCGGIFNPQAKFGKHVKTVYTQHCKLIGPNS